ncbi:DUF2268 domain-containing putative Zn-dependent protease [Exiguobacterium sp. s193]|uniref:DUF2268 domain-containing protein n=1 Tax=Exiguobacterium sp. s193 TaxID=2751207 RepID=UPI001BE9611A|nr:DUF2268 domain-containing putative Zn-dependent protease [Exiguobacterium sp. s193]
MKKVIVPLLCVPFLLLSACSDEKEKAVTHSESKEFKPETVKIGKDSELNIVPLYTPYQTYLKASLKADTSEMDVKNYAKYVLGYIDEIGKKENFDTTSLKGYFMLQSTAYEQELVDRTNDLMKHHDEIKDIIIKNYTAANKVLPKKKSTIFIAPANSEYFSMSESMKGVFGAAYKDTFILYLDTNFDKNTLAYSIAHEYHHLILHDTPEYKMNAILDSIITEGKADAFADRVVKDVSTPWNVPMDDKTKKHVASLIESGEATYEEVVGGNHQKDIPQWSNYILGRDVMDHYFKTNPDRSISDWTFANQHDILKGYKYQDLLE